MVSLLRKYQQSLMVIVTGMVIVAFIWLYNGTRFDKIAADQAYKVYGKVLSRADVQRTARKCDLAMSLGLRELIGALSGGTNDRNQAFENFVWNSYVLDHHLKALGISVTDEEVIASIKKLPMFQTNGMFDKMKYDEFGQNFLSPHGFTDTEVENLVRDELCLLKLADLIGSTVDVTPSENLSLFVQGHQKVHLSLIQFNQAEFAASVTPKEDEIKKFYNDHKGALNSEERRAVSFVRLELSDAEKTSLKGKEKVAALQKLSDRANDFSQALLDKLSFEDAAKKVSLKGAPLKVEKTQEFTESHPCPELASVAPAIGEAFRLTEKDPNSEAVQTETGFYILHLDKLVPSRPLTLDEARAKVIDQIKNERGHELMVSKANEARIKLTLSLKTGKSFADAAKEAGLKVESFPVFSLLEPPADKPNANEIIEKAVELNDNALSDLVQTAEGGLMIHVDKRDPVEESKFKREISDQMSKLRERKRYGVFLHWLQLNRKAADIQSLEVRPQRG